MAYAKQAAKPTKPVDMSATIALCNAILLKRRVVRELTKLGVKVPNGGAK